MKTSFDRLIQFLLFVCPAVSIMAPCAWAQPSPDLQIDVYAGVSVTGAVGTVYSIEYVTDIGLSNTWRCLEFLQLSSSPYLWTDKSAPALIRRFYRARPFTAPTNLVFIPPGTFRMGSPTNEVDRYDNEGPQTTVTISRGFWMGKYELTQAEYQAVIGSNPSYQNGDRSGPPYNDRDYGTDLSRPVEQVSWDDATNYCAKVTQQQQAAGLIPLNAAYRLPTAAEWEYACRALTSDRRFFYGDDPDYVDLPSYAWFGEGQAGMTRPVGQKLANQWGLYDMYGNVWEWCQDWYGPYPGGSVTDPSGPTIGSDRVYRGASNYADATYCRSAQRLHGAPNFLRPDIGFRVVFAPVPP